jgi:hypothetical protein
MAVGQTAHDCASSPAYGLLMARANCGALLLACVALGAFVSPARAEPPWHSNAAPTSLEQRLGEVASDLAQRPARAFCNGAQQWTAFGTAYGFRSADLFSFVPYFDPGGAANFMELSPSVCSLGARFLGNPHRRGQESCSTRGGRCPSYRATVNAIETFAHESMHIAGIGNEAVAECFGIQLTRYVAARLGASFDFANTIGRSYLSHYQHERILNPDYWTASCHDGGPLDLWPDSPGWPSPKAISPTAIPTLPSECRCRA